ncbi:hypothetical protein PCL_05559 [Purpureocillium lilacinum]|uniref:Uncharacterized protein n=1 Tax=Purpureocillium lilacinum TaxID=33203 RepID=A0A2U3DUA4_PURLI|nr:hypothetical protein Purlil1_5550 [Purpureocillium lilacinum]PWI65831.1 hypothetical protein PCL_05559 [Purpureocillium lilacinum]
MSRRHRTAVGRSRAQRLLFGVEEVRDARRSLQVFLFLLFYICPEIICPPSARGAATERRLALGPHATEGQWRHPAALGGLLLLGAARRSSAPRPIQRAPRCNGRGIVVLVLAQAPVSACLHDESAKTVEVWIANARYGTYAGDGTLVGRTSLAERRCSASIAYTTVQYSIRRQADEKTGRQP